MRRPGGARGEHHSRSASRNLNLKAGWNVGRWRAPLFAGGSASFVPRIPTPALGPERCVPSPRLGFLLIREAASPPPPQSAIAPGIAVENSRGMMRGSPQARQYVADPRLPNSKREES
jgi:hypothetical protein